MKAITKQKTVEALKKVFKYKAHKDNREVIVAEKENGGAMFMIDKRYMERFMVIGKLQEFFAERYIEGGQCRVDAITLIYTVFFIEDRPPKVEK